MRRKGFVKKVIATTLVIASMASSAILPAYATSSSSADESTTETEESSGLTQQQKNSIAMLNYLTVVNQEINDSSNSKLALEEVYSSLINNTSPNAIDELTQQQLTGMLQTIDKYRMIDVKRERLQYIYEQNKAQAIREAVPNPLGLLSATQSFRLVDLIGSVVYMAVDAEKSYKTASAQADLQYLQDGWELDDAATNALNSSREDLFNYMINMVQENDIPDEYALTESAVEKFVDCKNNDNYTRRIEFLESNQNTYENFGDYWLLLAQSYSKVGDYKSCFDAFDKYEEIQPKIFRKDRNLAQELPLAISACEESITDEDDCVDAMLHYVTLLTNNLESDSSDWALRYFAAQTYIEIYNKTKAKSYLERAYQLTLDNVNYLIDEQRTENSTYLADVVEKEIDKNATDEEKEEIKNYNKMLKEDRKTELPPVYEPLYLDCDLLFSLADEINISDAEKDKIEKILYSSGDDESDLFLTAPLNKYYSFKQEDSDDTTYDISYDKGELKIPAAAVSDLTTISVTITSGENTSTITDWNISEVKRKETNDISTFTAIYKSDSAKKYDYADGDVISVSINPVDGSNCPPITASFEVQTSKKLFVIPDLNFERTDL